ncbi:MAG: hypothetical protein K2K02_01210, partial [Ruminococcus sp.]|nr:hypothetical protein [Ruminococcus sp.]
MEYLTVKETAKLKSCSGSYVSRMIRDRKIEFIEKINLSNNQPYYLIPVSALPEDLQEKYYRQKRTESGVLPEKNSNESKEKTVFKCRLKGVKKAFEEFSEAERTEIKFWTDLLTQ